MTAPVCQSSFDSLFDLFPAAKLPCRHAWSTSPLPAAVNYSESRMRGKLVDFRVVGSFEYHKTLRTTPAMAANVTERLWEMGDIVDMLEAWEGRK
jgi:hypothetical protein